MLLHGVISLGVSAPSLARCTSRRLHHSEFQPLSRRDLNGDHRLIAALRPRTTREHVSTITTKRRWPSCFLRTACSRHGNGACCGLCQLSYYRGLLFCHQHMHHVARNCVGKPVHNRDLRLLVLHNSSIRTHEDIINIASHKIDQIGCAIT
jgi:hypothetical protein